jgi:hypothetical protein
MLPLQTLNLLMKITLEKFGLLMLTFSETQQCFMVASDQCLRLVKPLLLAALTNLVVLGLLVALLLEKLCLQLKYFVEPILTRIQYLPKAIALGAREQFLAVLHQIDEFALSLLGCFLNLNLIINL